MQSIGLLQSIQVGKPEKYTLPASLTEKEHASWRTSFFRSPSPQPRWLYTTHLEGNEQADKKNHGQLDQAVLLYASSHYPLWQAELDLPEIGPGGFGENLTLEGITENIACIGDIYALGDAHIQVSGPRYPCSKIERRWARPGLTQLVAETGRTGWYCSVLHEGLLKPGQALTLIERSYPQWTIALINDFAHGRNHDATIARELASCPLLHDFWRKMLLRYAKTHY